MNLSGAIDDPNRLPWLADDVQPRRGRALKVLVPVVAAVLTVPLAGAAYWLGMKSTGLDAGYSQAENVVRLPAAREKPMLIDHLNLRPPPVADPLAVEQPAMREVPVASVQPKPMSRQELVALRRERAVAARRLPSDQSAVPQDIALEGVRLAQARTPETDASFSCALAKTPAKVAVCNSDDLVKLDRHLSLFYTQAFVNTDEAKRTTLLRTRGKFEAGREACRSEECLKGAYLARIREVGEIIAGTAKPQAAAGKKAGAKSGGTTSAREPQADASFSCALAKTRGQVAVCNSDGLVKLDQQLSLYYTQAFVRADPDERDELLKTRVKFNARRDACTSNACLTSAYFARIREVAAIVKGGSVHASR